jgi:hypothetical protein
MLDVEQRKPPLRGLPFDMSVTLTCLFFAHRFAARGKWLRFESEADTTGRQTQLTRSPMTVQRG